MHAYDCLQIAGGNAYAAAREAEAAWAPGMELIDAVRVKDKPHPASNVDRMQGVTKMNDIHVNRIDCHRAVEPRALRSHTRIENRSRANSSSDMARNSMGRNGADAARSSARMLLRVAGTRRMAATLA